MKQDQNLIVVLRRHKDNDPELRPIAFDRLQTFAGKYLNDCQPFDSMELLWKGKSLPSPTKNNHVWKVKSDVFNGILTEIIKDGKLNLGYTLHRKIFPSDLTRAELLAIDDQPKIETVTPKKRTKKSGAVK